MRTETAEPVTRSRPARRTAGRAPVRAVYPGTFNPFTPGHLDVVERARALFDEVIVLVAVNGDKQPGSDPEQRAAAVRAVLPTGWTTVTVAAWSGLTAAYCRRHGAGVIVRGVRNTTDLQAEQRLAAMNQSLGVPTVFLPARPELAATSSTAARATGQGTLRGHRRRGAA
ncbi:pantetheine-phosphate adenylyltransferase [Micromonospora sp. WMMD975]|uniref:pantetheine-phosphate adenylyltransferase n=1 Tax=Micromonospora sp. WMMD975 TaxID=3016087 RepID=UPI00249CBB96|nr:pantetheine-phosphate adenylyltransferase [Micromonospora sp. WMMD975]WFE36101.1 pantetheine-phosphate adenylyltransferase [Micromonospora sp. WMMD975]